MKVQYSPTSSHSADSGVSRQGTPANLSIRSLHRPVGTAILLTGLSGAGKSTIAEELHRRFETTAHAVTMLDGDQLRLRFSADLGFTRKDRTTNLYRAALIAAETVRHGGIAICSFIAPFAASRGEFRRIVSAHGRVFVVHVATPLAVCESRDPKGLYKRARAREIELFTGISDVYEVPDDSEVTLDTTRVSVSVAVDNLIAGLVSAGAPLHFMAACRMSDRPHSAEERFEADNKIVMRIYEAFGMGVWGLPAIAQHLGIERHGIEAAIKRSFGQSFRTFKQRFLFEHSLELLRRGVPPKEVAYALRFSSPQSFHRFFRRNSGTSPGVIMRSSPPRVGMKNPPEM